MRFLVTGATGFIGKRVIAQLLKRNIPSIATDIRIEEEKESFFQYLKNKNINHQNLNLIYLDISSKKDIQNIFNNDLLWISNEQYDW